MTKYRCRNGYTSSIGIAPMNTCEAFFFGDSPDADIAGVLNAEMIDW